MSYRKKLLCQGLEHHDCHNSHRILTYTRRLNTQVRPDLNDEERRTRLNRCIITTISLVSRGNPDICIDNSRRVHGHEKNGDGDGEQSSQAGAAGHGATAPAIRVERAARSERPAAVEGSRRAEPRRRGAETARRGLEAAASRWGEAGGRGRADRRWAEVGRRGARADRGREARRRGEAGRRARAHRRARVGASRRGAAARAKKTKPCQIVFQAHVGRTGLQRIGDSKVLGLTFPRKRKILSLK